jgi:hypothetical protein
MIGCLIFAILGIVAFFVVAIVGTLTYIILPIIGVVLLIALVHKGFGAEIQSFLGGSKEKSAENQRLPQGRNPGGVTGQKLFDIESAIEGKERMIERLLEKQKQAPSEETTQQDTEGRIQRIRTDIQRLEYQARILRNRR